MFVFSMESALDTWMRSASIGQVMLLLNEHRLVTVVGHYLLVVPLYPPQDREDNKEQRDGRALRYFGPVQRCDDRKHT